MTDTTPVILVSGYLGAGKTTLVNNLLRNAEGTRLAILVNEFGDLPIDEDLIETKDEKLISISGGCICCSFGDDLTGALKDLTEIDPMPDGIVIESSGVALPNQSVANVTLLENLYFRGVLCVVDSSTLLSKIKNQYISDIIIGQIKAANLVLLNKTDLCSPTLLTLIKNQLYDTFEVKHIINTTHADLSLGILHEIDDHNLSKSGSLDAHDIFESFILYPEKIKSPEEVKEVLCTWDGLERVKGYFCDQNNNTWLIQLSGDTTNLEKLRTPRQSGLVIIGLKGKIDQKAIKDRFEKL